MSKIDFTKVKQDAKSVAEPIPVPTLRPQAQHNTPETHKEAAKKAGKPPKQDSFHYTRVGFAADVWQGMKYKKLMGDESFTDQINNAMRQYLGLKQ